MKINHRNSVEVKWNLSDVTIVIFLFLLLIGILVLLFFNQFKQARYLFYLTGVCSMTGLVFWRVKSRGAKLRDVGLARLNIGLYLLKGALLGASFFLVIGTALYYRHYISIFEKTSSFTLYNLLIAVIVAFVPNSLGPIFIAPFTEELFFRGFLLQALLKNLNKLLSIGVVAILATLLHMIYPSALTLNYCMVVLLCNIFLGWLFLRYRNLVMNFACHATVNYLAIIFAILIK